MVKRKDGPDVCPGFKLINEHGSPAEFVGRRETKYAFQNIDVGTLRRLLETNCRRLIHKHRVSVVRSIYFDDAQLTACRSNINGLEFRRKLRLRWYDSPKPGNEFFIELKWRDNQVTGKHRMQLRSSTALEDLSYTQIRSCLVGSVPAFLIRDVLKFNEPIVLVQYKREHFKTDDGLRITLDYDLTFYDQTGRQKISALFPRRLSELVVLEGKTPVGREFELRRWLHPLSPRASRCSKYVHGCWQIGLLDGRDL